MVVVLKKVSLYCYKESLNLIPNRLLEEMKVLLRELLDNC